jgi:3-methyladenine DNA glycosylase AlkD
MSSRNPGPPPTLADTLDALRAAADPEAAVAMSAYMRDQFPFLGLPRPRRAAIAAPYLKAARHLPPTRVLAVLNETFALPEREFHYLGIDIFTRAYAGFEPDDIAAAVPFIDRHAWWDSVDALRKPLSLWTLAQRRSDASSTVSGRGAELHRELHERLLGGSMWQRRVAITLQLQWKQDTDAALLADAIVRNAADQEFFIQKAIGWALRDFARTDPGMVLDLIEAAPLTGVARREATKHL